MLFKEMMPVGGKEKIVVNLDAITHIQPFRPKEKVAGVDMKQYEKISTLVMNNGAMLHVLVETKTILQWADNHNKSR